MVGCGQDQGGGGSGWVLIWAFWEAVWSAFKSHCRPLYWLHMRGQLKFIEGTKHNDSPAISPPPYCTEFEYGDFLAPGPRRQYVVR